MRKQGDDLFFTTVSYVVPLVMFIGIGGALNWTPSGITLAMLLAVFGHLIARQPRHL